MEDICCSGIKVLKQSIKLAIICSFSSDIEFELMNHTHCFSFSFCDKWHSYVRNFEGLSSIFGSMKLIKGIWCSCILDRDLDYRT